jgi:hypothetical protein
MCARVQNMEYLSVLNAKTGLIGSSGAQTDLIDRPTSLTGPVSPNSFDLVPRVENSAFDNSK